ncbi:MFS transporter [Sphaerimonospora sp. CA-214678]|uniref:MFS transporter n=1 Tax=Sphaerimonospora sp. CA-214678 TaxID=3240029 RepID=UPI003D8F5241
MTETMIRAERGSGRNEAVLVALTGITNLADGVVKISLPVLAVAAGGSAGQVAGVALTLTLPWLLASLPVGVLADRVDRRRLAVGANLFRSAAVVALLAASTVGAPSLPVLYAAGLVIGLAEVVADTAVSAVIPAAVPVERRARANAWIAGTETVANEFCGPAIGGLLVGIGAAVALGSATAAFTLGAVLMTLLVGRFRATGEHIAVGDAWAAGAHGDAAHFGAAGDVRATGEQDAAGHSEAAGDVTAAGDSRAGGGSVVADIREGLVFLWRHRLLRTLSLTIAVLAGSWSAWLALLPSYATSVLELDPAGYGLLVGAIGAGGLAGAVSTSAVNRLLGVRWALFADLVGTFLMMAVPAVLPAAWAVGTAAFVGGMGGTLWTVNSRTISQALVPDRLLGRYGSAARLLGWGTLPLGAGLAGVLADAFGLRPAFAVFAAAVAVLAVPFLRTVTAAELAAAGDPYGHDQDRT